MTSLEKIGTGWINSSEKRRRDIALAVAVAPVAILASPVIMAASRLLDGSGVMFHEPRTGSDGDLFELYKFRSMSVKEPGIPSAGPNDPRCTKLGKLLRRSAIDEIPQLANIIMGQMSFVGPRAAQPGLFEDMEAALKPEKFRVWEDAYFSSTPGGISSFTIAERYQELEGEEFLKVRAEYDIRDFNHAGASYDSYLLSSAVKLAIGR